MLLPPMWYAGRHGAISVRHRQPRPLHPVADASMARASRCSSASFAAIGAMLFGTTLALLAGYFGGWVDRDHQPLVDLWMSLPPVVLSLTLMVGFGTGVGNVILVHRAGGLDAFLPRGALRSDRGRRARISSRPRGCSALAICASSCAKSCRASRR